MQNQKETNDSLNDAEENTFVPAIKCPYCAEEIQAAAKKCKHCGEWLTAPLSKETGENPAQSAPIGFQRSLPPQLPQETVANKKTPVQLWPLITLGAVVLAIAAVIGTQMSNNHVPSSAAVSSQPTAGDSESSTSSTNTSGPLKTDYDSIDVGASRSSVTQTMGREPDYTYQTTDGSNCTALCYKDPTANFNELRVFVNNDSATVSRVSYFPANDPAGSSETKGN